ncbi:DUF1634 domain-containing protein [Phormidium sp. LEGE 05292]|uniref:DUF1634 domain-containing protein n=1 Tax=[Phormidium] sp. LEGE 05292 TaxID=767427 RepID=UPI0018806191|nr:DUF1634 domain-containing protein [Phormidium sp. LEGE 05292]MBE9229260.1 DUF1634 domain-containing protein [Phormidium sp. LEGE 05292]
MAKSTEEIAEHRFAQFLGNLLRFGVSLAVIFVVIGGVRYLSHYGMNPPNYEIFRGEPADLRSIPGVASDVLSFRRRGFIQFGLLILIATPILRVAFSAIAFAKQGDRTYLIITLVVLAILLYSLFNPT